MHLTLLRLHKDELLDCFVYLTAKRVIPHCGTSPSHLLNLPMRLSEPYKLVHHTSSILPKLT